MCNVVLTSIICQVRILETKRVYKVRTQAPKLLTGSNWSSSIILTVMAMLRRSQEQISVRMVVTYSSKMTKTMQVLASDWGTRPICTTEHNFSSLSERQGREMPSLLHSLFKKDLKKFKFLENWITTWDDSLTMNTWTNLLHCNDITTFICSNLKWTIEVVEMHKYQFRHHMAAWTVLWVFDILDNFFSEVGFRPFVFI